MTDGAEPQPAARGWLGRLDAAVFTTDLRQRLRLQQALLSIVLMTLSVAVFAFAADVAGTPPAAVVAWAGVSLGGMVAIGASIRAGASRRLEDPSLALPQMLLAITSAAVGYTLAGPMRGIAFPILMVILMFGMFQLRPALAGGMSAYALLAFAAAMAWKAHTEPAVFAPAVEWGHFVMLAATLPAVSLLAGRLARIRSRERRQRRDLHRALSRIQDLATKDGLTGLVNRRHMTQLLEQERQRGARSGRSFALAMVDIDQFKAVNDQHGHAVGDEVLQSLARQMPQALRATDVVARWGGEEFLVLMPEAALGTARTGLERVRGRIAATPVAHLSGVPVYVTVSAGVTEHLAGETVQQTFERADRALYEAKAQGRNRIVVA